MSSAATALQSRDGAKPTDDAGAVFYTLLTVLDALITEDADNSTIPARAANQSARDHVLACIETLVPSKHDRGRRYIEQRYANRM